MGISFFMEYFPNTVLLSFLAKTDKADDYVAGAGLGIVIITL